MSMSIHFNPASYNATNALNKSNERMGTAMQRLTSGLRVNSAKDDK